MSKSASTIIKNTTRINIPLSTVMLCVLIFLKTNGQIDWSWTGIVLFVVFFPFISAIMIFAGIAVILLACWLGYLIIMSVCIVMGAISDRRRKRRRLK